MPFHENSGIKLRGHCDASVLKDGALNHRRWSGDVEQAAQYAHYQLQQHFFLCLRTPAGHQFFAHSGHTCFVYVLTHFSLLPLLRVRNIKSWFPILIVNFATYRNLFSYFTIRFCNGYSKRSECCEMARSSNRPPMISKFLITCIIQLVSEARTWWCTVASLGGGKSAFCLACDKLWHFERDLDDTVVASPFLCVSPSAADVRCGYVPLCPPSSLSGSGDKERRYYNGRVRSRW